MFVKSPHYVIQPKVMRKYCSRDNLTPLFFRSHDVHEVRAIGESFLMQGKK